MDRLIQPIPAMKAPPQESQAAPSSRECRVARFLHPSDLLIARRHRQQPAASDGKQRSQAVEVQETFAPGSLCLWSPV